MVKRQQLPYIGWPLLFIFGVAMFVLCVWGGDWDRGGRIEMPLSAPVFFAAIALMPIAAYRMPKGLARNVMRCVAMMLWSYVFCGAVWVWDRTFASFQIGMAAVIAVPVYYIVLLTRDIWLYINAAEARRKSHV